MAVHDRDDAASLILLGGSVLMLLPQSIVFTHPYTLDLREPRVRVAPIDHRRSSIAVFEVLALTGYVASARRHTLLSTASFLLPAVKGRAVQDESA